ncbi:hypothetical protein [Rhizobium tumorigenes]|uniref:hypothetical protein n=1 Tax=Rhizobium tumorigenes TaxID=2041385 RepID=UPI00241C6B1D|nr:hypothetical protein [Rhizobium tumorigenes]WFS02748.1 hypothetical protein PR016_09175 [Rhizobium tumorigenes]
MLPQLLNAKLSVEKAMITDPFAKLPLFATDDEIAIAIVGKSRASDWKRGSLRVLEDRGFPLIDPLHGGRPVPLIKKWYDLYLGVDRSYVQRTQEDGKENLEAFRRKVDVRNERKPQLGLDGRSQKALLFMVAHPDAQTAVAIPNAGAFSMERLAEKGAVVAGSKDREGDIEWTVTDVGREEAARIDLWFNGKTAGRGR